MHVLALGAFRFRQEKLVFLLQILAQIKYSGQKSVLKKIFSTSMCKFPNFTQAQIC